MRIFLDSAPVIYAVEQIPVLGNLVDIRLASPGITCVASELTRMECRVKPLRLAALGILQDFEDYFTFNVAEMVSLSRNVLDRAAEIRAQYGYKSPDAIQLAAAQVSACDVFLTNDRRLTSFSGMVIEIVKP